MTEEEKLQHDARIRDAVLSYSQRNPVNQRGRGRPKRKQPEEDVVSDIFEWAQKNHVWLNRLESKWVSKVVDGKTIYVSSGVERGTPDLVGCGDGYYVAIEAKARGRRSTIRSGQYDYLVEVIKHGGFGVCVDNVVLLRKWWNEYKDAMGEAGDLSAYLLELLPVPKKPFVHSVCPF